MNNNRKLKTITSKDIFQQEEVQQFSLSLSGKMAMNTAIMTPYEIAGMTKRQRWTLIGCLEFVMEIVCKKV